MVRARTNEEIRRKEWSDALVGGGIVLALLAVYVGSFWIGGWAPLAVVVLSFLGLNAALGQLKAAAVVVGLIAWPILSLFGAIYWSSCFGVFSLAVWAFVIFAAIMEATESQKTGPRGRGQG